MVVNDYQAEVERLRESHRLDRLQLGVEQEELIRQLEARHLAQLVNSDKTKLMVKQQFVHFFNPKLGGKMLIHTATSLYV